MIYPAKWFDNLPTHLFPLSVSQVSDPSKTTHKDREYIRRKLNLVVLFTDKGAEDIDACDSIYLERKLELVGALLVKSSNKSPESRPFITSHHITAVRIIARLI